MREVTCPNCGSERVYHYTDAYIVRKPAPAEGGRIELLEFETAEFSEFFQRRGCAFRSSEAELVAGALLVRFEKE